MTTDDAGRVRALMILTELTTLVQDDDLDTLVRLAVTAEAEGVDAVMMSEHIALGESAFANGPPVNERGYAAPGNQDPRFPWPSTIVLGSAMAARTTRLRIALAAVIAPLRHPLLLAKEWATLDRLSHGRLAVLPTVSWHAQEYAALGVEFRRRGRILDEQLEVLTRTWQGAGPLTFHGEFFDIERMYSAPPPLTPGGPPLWFGGSTVSEAVIGRLVRHGRGFNPFGPVSAEDLGRIDQAMTAAGRSLGDLELIGGVRADLPDDGGPASLDAAIATAAPQVDAGYRTICIKPSMFIDSLDEYPDFCRAVVRGLDALS